MSFSLCYLNPDQQATLRERILAQYPQLKNARYFGQLSGELESVPCAIQSLDGDFFVGGPGPIFMDYNNYFFGFHGSVYYFAVSKLNRKLKFMPGSNRPPLPILDAFNMVLCEAYESYSEGWLAIEPVSAAEVEARNA